MAVPVNPPLHVLFPQNNPFKRGSAEYSFTQALMSSLRQQQLIIDALWRRVGGNVDIIETVSTESNTSLNYTALSDGTGGNLETTVLSPGDTTYTTSGSENIICTNTAAATISLNQYPDDQEIVRVTRVDAQVTVNGNGKNILGDTSVIINTQYTTLDFIFITESDQWFIN